MFASASAAAGSVVVYFIIARIFLWDVLGHSVKGVILSRGMLLSIIIPLVTGYPITLLIANYVKTIKQQKELIEHQAATVRASESKLLQSNKELAIAKEKAEQDSRSKGDFLANMSHEIRTPMNGILGMTRLILGMELGLEQKKLLANVLYSAESLLGILNDILDYSKIEAEQLVLESHSFNLESMLDHVVSSLSLQAIEKNIYLDINVDFTTTSKYIRADELRIKQVLVNLIGNAIKFTTLGGVFLIVETISEIEGTTLLKFSVKDTGLGIAQEKQKSIFNSFTQADTSTSREFGGTGLGLTISQRLVELMGSEITIKSVEGVGSIFSFAIEVFKSKKEDTDVSILPQGSRYKELQILLVEDNEINQELARILLEQDEQQVTVADNGLEALQLIAENHFDLILMDMQMPKMNGILATEIIRSCEKGKTGNPKISKQLEEKLIAKNKGQRTPIIAITANVMERERQECYEAGMDDFLTKPFMPKHLHKKLDKLSISVSASVQADSTIKTKKKSPTKRVVDFNQKAFEHLKNFYEINDDGIKGLLKRVIHTISEDLSLLAQALQNEDTEQIKKIGHRLRGSFLNLGFEELAELAKNIELIESVDDSKKEIQEFIEETNSMMIIA